MFLFILFIQRYIPAFLRFSAKIKTLSLSASVYITCGLITELLLDEKDLCIIKLCRKKIIFVALFKLYIFYKKIIFSILSIS